MKLEEILCDEYVGKEIDMMDKNGTFDKVTVKKTIVDSYELVRFETGEPMTNILYLSTILKANYQIAVDWDKVPKGTKVQVRNGDNERWKNRYFISKDDMFRVSTISKDDEFTGETMYNYGNFYNQCRLYKEIEN